MVLLFYESYLWFLETTCDFWRSPRFLEAIFSSWTRPITQWSRIPIKHLLFLCTTLVSKKAIFSSWKSSVTIFITWDFLTWPLTLSGHKKESPDWVESSVMQPVQSKKNSSLWLYHIGYKQIRGPINTQGKGKCEHWAGDWGSHLWVCAVHGLLVTDKRRWLGSPWPYWNLPGNWRIHCEPRALLHSYSWRSWGVRQTSYMWWFK